jgi:hypothetical protein
MLRRRQCVSRARSNNVEDMRKLDSGTVKKVSEAREKIVDALFATGLLIF